MANNNFNTKEFLRGAYFSPIQLGKHRITLGKVVMVIEEDDNGNDKSYIKCPIIFENNRTVDTRFYGLGAKIFCDQVRAQLNDETDYAKLGDFLKSLKDKSVDLCVSKRTYTTNAGEVKTTLQYDFLEPEAVTEASTAEAPNNEEGPF